VTGWIKRGSTGVIGTNRACADETISALVDDYRAGALTDPIHPSDRLARVLVARQPDTFDYAGWRVIDHEEQVGGRLTNRPRRKLVRRQDLVAAAAAARGESTGSVHSS
jgi:ferredoxin--NADP+ reductase